MHLEKGLLNHWHNNLHNILQNIRQKQGIYRAFLHVSTFCFEKVVKLRNYCYDTGLKKEKKALIPVISIGNVAVGGTGKTPFTMFLAKALQTEMRIAILTRGYRSLAEKEKKPIVVSDGDGRLPLHPPEMVGDEAYLMAKNLPNVIVISGRDRFSGTMEAQKRGAQLVLLDDGMQHRKLSRDIEIVMVNGEENRQKFLPFGNLRDDPKRLITADFLISRGKDFSDTITVSDRVVGIVDKQGKLKESLLGMPVAIFCGIARPESFVKTVEECGTKVVASLFLADHEKADIARLNAFAEEAKGKGAFLLLCTEKDFVKYEDETLALPLWWVKRDMYVSRNSIGWNALMQKIRGLTI